MIEVVISSLSFLAGVLFYFLLLHPIVLKSNNRIPAFGVNAVLAVMIGGATLGSARLLMELPSTGALAYGLIAGAVVGLALHFMLTKEPTT